LTLRLPMLLQLLLLLAAGAARALQACREPFRGAQSQSQILRNGRFEQPVRRETDFADGICAHG